MKTLDRKKLEAWESMIPGEVERYDNDLFRDEDGEYIKYDDVAWILEQALDQFAVEDERKAEIRYDERGEIDEVVGSTGVAERCDDDFVSMWIGDSLFRLVAWDDELKWDLVERGPNSTEVHPPQQEE